MLKIKLSVFLLMLCGSIMMFDSPITACSGGGENCPQANRPVGCACCSDNHCASGKCDITTEKCVNKDDGPLPEEPPQN